MYKNPSDWAFVSRAECQTIVDYLPFIQYEEIKKESNEIDPELAPQPLNVVIKKNRSNEALLEIIGDEMNHAIIALFECAKLLGIKIPMDNFPKDLPFKE